MPRKYTTCTVPGCDRKHAAYGFCHPHYWRWRKRGNPGPATIDTKPDLTTEERFWSKVDRSGGPDACWPWKGRMTPNGYGRFTDKKRDYPAHRMALIFTAGPMPPDKPCACHSCDNPPCCNPAHLWAGSAADNAADMKAKGRSATGDKNGMQTHPERRSTGDANGARKHPERLRRGAENGTHTHPERRPHGERHGCAKLTEEIVRAIRAEYARGGVLQREIGERYGVTQTTIHAIVTGKIWTHLT